MDGIRPFIIPPWLLPYSITCRTLLIAQHTNSGIMQIADTIYIDYKKMKDLQESLDNFNAQDDSLLAFIDNKAYILRKRLSAEIHIEITPIVYHTLGFNPEDIIMELSWTKTTTLILTPDDDIFDYILRAYETNYSFLLNRLSVIRADFKLDHINDEFIIVKNKFCNVHALTKEIVGESGHISVMRRIMQEDNSDEHLLLELCRKHAYKEISRFMAVNSLPADPDNYIIVTNEKINTYIKHSFNAGNNIIFDAPSSLLIILMDTNICLSILMDPPYYNIMFMAFDCLRKNLEFTSKQIMNKDYWADKIMDGTFNEIVQLVNKKMKLTISADGRIITRFD